MASSDSATLDNAQPRVCYTTRYMPERLHQFRFDAQFGSADPLDVTPARFTGVRFPTRRQEQSAAHMGRFIREVNEEVFVISPQAAGRYLLEKVYIPFELFDQEETWVLGLR